MEKITKLLLVVLLFVTTFASAQYGIGTNSPSPSAQLELNSTAKGFLMPRMTTLQRDDIASPAAGLMIYNVETNKPNFFNGVSWIELAGVIVGGATQPGAPTDIVVTPGDAQASVAFTAPTNNGGNAITNYIVTANPGALTASGATSPITVTGLVNGTAYTFSVVAVNAVGNSASSTVSSTVTPVGAPGAPTDVVASYTAGTTQASIAFTAPTNTNGAAITGYTVTSNPGGLTATGATSPLVVTGLSMNQAYTFTVVANNGSASVASAASNSITTVPVVPTAPLNLVASSTASGTASLAFDVPASNGGAAITNYVVTSNPAGGTGSGSASPIAVSGLTDGTSYTFTLVATNSAGNSPASAASNAITPVGAPGAPTSIVASYTAGTTEASVAFTAPTNNGGAAITGYTVTSNPGGLTASGASSPLVVTGLTMNQAYTFTVVANNGSASVASAASNSITTVPVAPSAPLNLVASSSASGTASIAFGVPASNGGAAITNYVVTSTPVGGTGSGSASPIAVSGLTDGIEYTFTLVATNSAGNSPASAASNAITPVGAPQPPTSIVASYTAGTTEASVAFTAPSNNGGAAITGYTVTSNPGGLTASGASSPLVVTGLSMNQAYTFTVVANNGSASVASAASNSITTVPVVPSAPLNLVASSSASGTASLAFDVPASDGGAAITNYVVTSNPAGGTGSGSASPIAVSGLTDGISYTFTLVATNSAGDSPASAASNAVTPVGAPGAPTSIVASYTAGTTEASVAFTAPTNNGGAAITGYTVTSNPGGLTATGASSPLVVTGLTMNQAYTFTVVANNGSASAASAASNSITTVPVVPSAPLNLVASSSASGTASLAFDVPASNGGAAITNYVVTSTPVGGTGSGSASPIAVSGLTDGISYTFTLVATNSAGDSPASAASNAVTPVGAPGAPTSIVASYTAGTTEASVAFTAPTNNGGAAITGYTVTSNPGGLTASGASSPLVVTGLTMNQAYTFTVVANNGSASAASAASNSITTVPVVPTAPLNLVASSSASGTASLAFDVPASNGGAAITNYVVTSNPAGGTGSGSTSPIAVSGLTDGISYTFTLVATNSAGDSPASAASNAITPVGAPQPPTSIVASYTAGTTEASVAFTAPTNNGGAAITGYTVTSNPGGLTASGASSPLVVTGLSMNQAYTFTVVANNGSASAASAASNSITTVPVVPTAPLNLVASSTASGTASIAFGVPASNGGAAITNYVVTSNPAGGTGSGSASPIAVSGLTDGISYTFTLVATNSAGDSPASAASNAITPVGAPQAPTNVVATYTAGYTSATITFTAPTNTGGLPITGYTVTSSGTSVIVTPGTTTSIVVENLVMPTNIASAGNPYRFSVTATNSGGTSVASALSNQIFVKEGAPGAPTKFTATLNGGSVTFSWAAPTDGGPVSNYMVQRRGTLSSQTWSNLDVLNTGVPGNQLTATYSNLAGGPSEWNYRVLARNGGYASFETASTNIVVVTPVANSVTDFYDNFNTAPSTPLWEADPTPFGWYQTASTPSFFGNATNISKMYGQADGRWLVNRESSTVSLAAKTVHSIDRTGKTVEIQFGFNAYTIGTNAGQWFSFGLKSESGPSNGVSVSWQVVNGDALSGNTNMTVLGDATPIGGITAKSCQSITANPNSGDPSKVTVKIVLLNGGGMEMWSNGTRRQTWTAAELPAAFNNLKFFVRAARNTTDSQKIDDFYIISY